MTQELEQIVIDPSPEDGFNLDTSASEITSLRSSIIDYVYENGRRYHAYHSGSYWGSNDEKSMSAMDIQHHVYTLMLHGRLFLAPVPDNVKRVLDIGTGTGKWAIDMGDLYPNATVIGTDLSPIQPSLVPPNVKFEVDDCCDEWLYTQPFDFIHVRGLFGCISDWHQFYTRALQNLQPGGYLEQLETGIQYKSDDGSLRNTKIEEGGKLSMEAGTKFGKSFRTVEEMHDNMIKAGFVDVKIHYFKLPVGPWPKDKHLKTLGKYQRLACQESVEMWVMMLYTRVLGWSREEVDVFLAGVLKEWYDPSIHSYQDVRVCYGRKPTAEESAK